jgi:hypothetical protein
MHSGAFVNWSLKWCSGVEGHAGATANPVHNRLGPDKRATRTSREVACKSKGKKKGPKK